MSQFYFYCSEQHIEELIRELQRDEKYKKLNQTNNKLNPDHEDNIKKEDIDSHEKDFVQGQYFIKRFPYLIVKL